MIIFDLEWNCGQSEKVCLDEILQIGAVKCSRPGGTVEDTFCVYVRPKVHRHFSLMARLLPELPEALTSPFRFEDAAKAFFSWCGEERVFAAWGGNDFPALSGNLRYWGLEELEAALPKTYVDLQSAFDLSVAAANAVSLERAVEYCRVPDIFDPHNALSDAIYAWAVCAHIPDEALESAARSWKAHRGRSHALPKRALPWKGPYRNLDELLNSWGCRQAACPVCGETFPVSRWLYRNGGPCYGKFTCPQDGSRLWKLELFRDQKDRFWANGACLPWSGRMRAAFRNPGNGFQSLECVGRRRRKKKRRQKRGDFSGL